MEDPADACHGPEGERTPIDDDSVHLDATVGTRMATPARVQDGAIFQHANGQLDSVERAATVSEERMSHRYGFVARGDGSVEARRP